MSKLTDSQLIILSAAAAREDGCAVAPVKMNKAAAMKVGASLMARKLMRAAKAKPGAPVWRMDEDRPVSLVLTSAGRKAIGVKESAPVAKSGRASKDRSKVQTAPATKAARVAHQASGAEASHASPRAGSKRALLIEMLRAKTGATLDALVEATGWLPHTTRAALTGLRKRGYGIERRREGDASIYRIIEATSVAA